VWSVGIGYLFFKILSKFMRIRVTPEQELAGLDISEIGTPAYGDFQIVEQEVPAE